MSSRNEMQEKACQWCLQPTAAPSLLYHPLQAHGHLHGADLIARQEEHAAPLAGGSGSPAASGGEAREAAQDGAARQVMQEWAWTMDERSVMSLQLLDAQVSVCRGGTGMLR